MEERNYTVYIHRNKVNGKVYVGQTGTSTSRRWQVGGKGYRSQAVFWRAIGKYGWDGFTHGVFASNLTSDEADQMEEMLILLYGSFNRKYGYNVSMGGKGGINLNQLRCVSQYTKDGEFIAEYKSMKIAAEILGTSKSHISDVCRGAEKSASGFVWRYLGDSFDKYDTLNRNGEAQSKAVRQYDLDGIFITEFPSMREAAISVGGFNTNIGARCRGKYKQAYGFIWRYDEEVS